jgi:hypothetical protein
VSITLQDIESKQDELLALIASFKQQSQTTTLRIPAIELELQPGEWYAGAVLNEDGSVKHHTIVAKVSADGNDFDAAQDMAADAGLSAPTFQEARLIVAHRYGRLAGMSWFWLAEPHSNSAYAWYCYLGSGNVNYNHRSAGGGALAVRRVNP